MKPLDVLQQSSFGKRTAEDEQEQLRAYFDGPPHVLSCPPQRRAPADDAGQETKVPG